MGFLSSVLSSPVVGSLLGGGLALLGGERANASSAASVQQQMDFQERMRATQYQTTMADMRKAGLNPMLAAKVGGAGTPSGASMTFQNVGQAAADGAAKMSSSAVAMKRLTSEIENINADTELKKTTDKKTFIESGVKYQEGENLVTMGRILDEQLISAQKQAVYDDMDRKMVEDNPMVKNLSTLMRLLGFTGNSAVGNLRR